MSVKNYIKLFIPPILILIKQKMLNIIKKVEPFVSTIGEIKHDDDTLIVIGNGPSLTESMKKYKEKLKRKECIVVNHFCETELYEGLRPKYYLLADPAYWGDIDSYVEWKKNKITRFINVFVRKTTWDVNLILPHHAKGSRFVNTIENNRYIHVFYYNNSDRQEAKNLSRFDAWDANLIPPPAMTCLNTCVWLGIYLRFKNIYLIGADTNWLELLRVDQVTNELYTIDSHFYGKVKRQLYSDVAGTVPQRLPAELKCLSMHFEFYWLLRDYAERTGTCIYNASEYSLIDAFERKKLD